MLLVENCFHWIGFHIINHFLEKGCCVDGVDSLDTDKKEHLYLFVGRHSMFRHCQGTQKLPAQQYDVMIHVQDDTLEITGIQSVTVNLPFIFGEWMPTAHNPRSRSEDMPFHSKENLQQGIYVGDLVNSVEQWIQASRLPEIIETRSAEDPYIKDDQLENYVYIRNNRSACKNAEKVKSHYQRNRLFY